MQDWQNDFTYYWLAPEGLVGAPLSEVPEEVEDFWSIGDAVSYVQRLGCSGMNLHTQTPQTVLDVLKLAVEKYGEVHQKVLRGTRSQRPLSEYKILFGTTDRKVAEFYGDVTEHLNVRGIKYAANTLSVVSGDYSQDDEEIIFFPEG